MAIFSLRERLGLPYADKMPFDGIMGLVWDFCLGHSYSRQKIHSWEEQCIYFASTEIPVKVISDLHNALWKFVALFPPVPWSPCTSSCAVQGAK